jgi:hypothetical protein
VQALSASTEQFAAAKVEAQQRYDDDNVQYLGEAIDPARLATDKRLITRQRIALEESNIIVPPQCAACSQAPAPAPCAPACRCKCLALSDHATDVVSVGHAQLMHVIERVWHHWPLPLSWPPACRSAAEPLRLQLPASATLGRTLPPRAGAKWTRTNTMIQDQVPPRLTIASLRWHPTTQGFGKVAGP